MGVGGGRCREREKSCRCESMDAHGVTSKGHFAGSGGAAKERLPDGRWEHVVEIKMQLAENANPRSTGAVDRYHRLEPDLVGASDVDETGIDGASGGVGIAEIVGDRCAEAQLDDRNHVIDEIGQSEID